MKKILIILTILLNSCITINKTYYVPVKEHLDTIYLKEKIIFKDTIPYMEFPNKYYIPINYDNIIKL